ncbi:MAG: efflux RND transporter periplasmic adaptor subunit [Gemmatimonadota bacterium]|nr:efflux RND transporter periplasmic adaptor subunit [Gemmatimonadota bacterium]
MMRRRRRHRVLKWMLWIGGVLAAVVLSLSLIKIDDVVIAQGIVEPGTKIYIDSPLKRVIEAIHCEPGQPVKAGQPLVQLYNGDLLSAIEAAGKEVQRGEANLEHAWANLALLKEKPTAEALKIAESRVEQARIALKARKQELQRAETLYFGERLWSIEELERAKTNRQLAESNLKVAAEELNLTRRGASPAELRQAAAEVRQARAALAKSRSSLEGAREGLELTTMRSPVNGIVARRDLHPGMLADQGQIVLIIAGDGGDDTIDAWVPETNAWKIRLGHPVEILSNLFTDREEFVGAGEISRFYGYAVHGGGVRTFELEIRILETPLPLKYGSTADLRIIVGRRSILKTLLNIEDRDVVQASRAAHFGPHGRDVTQNLPTGRTEPDSATATTAGGTASTDSGREPATERNP